MAKKKGQGYLSAKESRKISRENRKITKALEKKYKRKNVPEEEFLTHMHDPQTYWRSKICTPTSSPTSAPSRRSTA